MKQRQRSFAFLVKDLSRLNAIAFVKASGSLNLTLSQCRVLIQLERNEGITQTRLAELTETEPMTLVRLLDRMEQDRWLSRSPGPQDRRTKRLHLMPAARPILEQIHRFSDRVRAKALAGVPVTERNQLMRVLEHVHLNLSTLAAADDDAAADTPDTGKI